MNARTQHAVQIVLILAALSLIAIFWNKLPDTIPIHYSLQGEPNNFGPKASVFLAPLVMLFLSALIYVLPYIDAKKHSAEQMPAYRSLVIIINSFLLLILSYQVLSTIGHLLPGRSWMPLIVIMLFMALGNYFSKLRPNYFIGIRTPWTLESEAVWMKTHRLAGYIWVLGSLIMIPLYLLVSPPAVDYLFGACIAIIAGVPIVYSFVVFKKLKRAEAGG
jgi:uncharacterized membrane protein